MSLCACVRACVRAWGFQVVLLNSLSKYVPVFG